MLQWLKDDMCCVIVAKGWYDISRPLTAVTQHVTAFNHNSTTYNVI
jgi:hypothetical protein